MILVENIEEEKDEVNAGHYPEIADRIDMLNLLLEERIINHPVALKHPELNEIFKDVNEKLFKAYQMVAELVEQP